MSRIRFALAAAAAVTLTLVATASAATPVKLSAVVGPGFNISLKKGTAKVKKLKAGKYLIVVSDKSKIHNFRLKGPGFNKKTGVGFKGTVRWKVTLEKGTYRFLCDPHAQVMKGSFKVT
jgi:plastocyanin